MSRPADRLVLSCEHASRAIPRRYRRLFEGADGVLATHRGSDIGAGSMSRHLAKSLDVDAIHADSSRLLVDCNRSPHHRALFSEFTRPLPRTERETILQRHYYPHRTAVERRLADTIDRHGLAVHVSVHSFTGELEGLQRQADIGLLYDPGRPPERSFCLTWQRRLRAGGYGFVARRNYPYLGVNDGLVTHLRKLFPPAHYIAVELEFNQGLVGTRAWPALKHALAQTLADTLAAVAATV